jgi:hypothetical protein
MACDPLPPSAALPLTEGENKTNLPLVRGKSERGGRSHIIVRLARQQAERFGWGIAGKHLIHFSA